MLRFTIPIQYPAGRIDYPSIHTDVRRLWAARKSVGSVS
jgi:hypothetical protein